MIKNTLTGKQKGFLRSMGMKLEPVVMIGKDGVTPQVVTSAKEAITKRELIKVRVLQNCAEMPDDAITMLAERIKDDNEVAAKEAVTELVGRLRPLLDKIEKYIAEKDMDKIVETDMEFHDFLYRASNNTRLEGIIFNLRGQLTQYRTVSMSCPGRL